MDAAAEEGVLDVDILADEGSEDEGDAPPSSGPASTPTSCASSPRGEEPASPHGSAGQPSFFHHQPYVRPFFTSNRRGPGRPRKEGVKLAKEGKIVRRYRGGNAGCLRGAKRARGSRDDEEVGEEDDFTMPAPEEPPYFPEKWPGKLCSLCNLGERSQLGQGEMRQIICNIEGVLDNGGSTPSASNSGSATPTIMATPSSTPTTPIPPGLGSPPPELLDPNQHPLAVPLSRRQKSHNKCKTPIYNLEHVDELSIIGHLESIEINAVVSSGAFYVHRLCLEFSPPFQDQVAPASNSEEEKEQLEEGRVKGVVTAGLFRKCAFCQRYGASIPCKMSCSKYFHFPCVLASGGFIDYQTKSSFCKDHLHQVPLICTADLNCRTCHVVGDLSNLMTCVTCGGHFHGTCVGLAQLPGVRAGWSCRGCRACQVCRGEVWTESRAVTCEHCDKLYHAACLRPPIATVPKYGWKCKCCRVCSDCGSRSPGAGPSSRWHAHYSVCDSCYQQRNKGCCCPLCRRAYRAAAMRDMLRCHKCTKYVHTMCDPEADPVQNRLRKEQTPSYEYVCPICKSNKGSFEEETTQTSQDSSSFGDDSTQEQDPLAIETKTDVGLGKGKPYTVSAKVAKKKIGVYKKGGFSPAGKLSFQKRQRTSYMEFGRKRGTKSKMRGVFGVPGLGLQRPQAPDIKNSTDDDPGLENKLVLCSSKDKFVLTQDLCVMCGAIGTDSEGCLIACAQCGQSYHPYCVNIKVSGVIVKLGWRCLECTVCEGCGLRGDDALLVLCDECDTAWHTYCARPALANVPRGAWRCERCRQCLTCGTRDTQHYTECDGCSSLHSCSVCSEPYSDGELIIQCSGCRRWLHAACDRIATESDADKCARHPYKCIGCRGGSLPPPHLAAAPPPPPAAARPPPPSPRALGLGGEYYVDDVCLSQRGAHHMKMLEAEMGVTHQRRKRRFKNDVDKDSAATQNAEDGEDNKPDSTAEVKDELGIPNANYKEGIPWNVATEGPPPEGFTIFTTDMGLTVLRRKRQRNLNKLGIGGFVVRQRQCNSKNQGDDDKDDGQPGSGESPGNKRKPRRKPRSKLMEQIPSYMQEAFFGKDLLEPSKPAVTSSGPDTTPTIRPPSPLSSVIYREPRDNNSESSDEEVLLALSTSPHPHNTINLNPEFLELLLSLKPKEEKDDSQSASADGSALIKTELTDDGHLKHTEDSTALKNAILGPQHSEGTVEQQTPNTDSIPTVHGTKTESIRSVSESGVPSQQRLGGVECVSLLGVNLEAMVRDTLPDMDTNDVDEIFKGVLTDDSQESQESTASYITSVPSTPYSQQRQQLQSPLEYASPYHTEYGSSSNSQLSPAFPDNSADVNAAAPVSTYNQRSADKMRADESLGAAATISAVLYANTNHPEWKAEFPSWVDRCKQILKKWRALPSEQKAPYLQRARDNRSAIRMKKAQQTATEGGPPSTPATPAAGPTPTPAAAPPAAATPALPTASAAATATATASPPQVVRAPNVTVTAGGLLEADQHIRVLTPSEIMRTLPPLHTEQERTTGVQRSAREAEQERQWKQLQQMRQQQTQHHHQVINDQRLQGNPLQAMRLRGPDGAEIIQGVVGVPDNTMVGGGPRSVFPAQRIPLHYGNASEHINRQLRDLLQRQSDNMWPPKAGSEEGVMQTNIDGSQQFRQPLPVGLRMRQPLQPGQRPDQQLLLQQRIIQSADGGKIQQTLQQSGEMKQTIVVHSNMQASEKQDGASDQGHDEMDMGDMDKLEQDTGNIGEVGDILTGLGGEDDEELLESLTAEIGEEFNILEYADPELASLNDAENILDGLELAEDGMTDRHAKREPHDGTTPKADNKLNAELQKSIKNIEMAKTIKSETESGSTEIKQENPGLQGYADNSQQRAIIQGQMNAQQSQLNIGTVKAEIKTEGDDWQRTQTQPQHFHSVRLPHQHPQGAVLAARRAQLQAGGTGQVMQQTFTQQGTAVGGQATTVQVNTAQIVSAMTAQVNAALAAGRVIAPGTRLVGADGAVGVVRHDRTVALHTLPHIATAVGGRPPPPPPYPGTLRQQPPPPPYPQQVPYDPMEPWPDWLHHRRPLLLQEQPLLLEELLEQEKREQERDVGGGGGGAEWAGGAGRAGGAAAPATPPAPAPAPLFAAAPPPAPPLPDAAAPPLAHQRYELWLAQYNAFAADQQRYYEHEVQKLRKIRKSLNSKQRQARKSGNELLPNDAAELRRVSTEQQALQKHLEAARKQSRQHTMLMQEYETKQRQNNPQLATQQTVGSQQQPMQGNQQQQIFTSSPINQQQQIFTSTSINQQSPQIQHQTITRPMQLGLQGNVQQQTLFRTQQVLNSDGQSQGITQQRIGLVTSPLNSQGRIIQQGGRTLVIEQGQQQQLVRQLSGQERPQVTGMVQFGQQQIVRNTMPVGAVRQPRPAMSPLHVQSPHSQSPLHMAPQSPLHHLTSPMQSPLHSQQSPLHHTSQSPLHTSTQSPLHTQQSPLHSQQSPLHVQQTGNLSQSPMHPQQSPMHQSPIHHQQQTSQSPLHMQQSPMNMQQSSMHMQQSPMHQQSQLHQQQQQQQTSQSPLHMQQSPMHMQQSPMHMQQSPMHSQQSPLQTSMSPQHFLQQLQAQRTSPQLPTPSRSPQIYQQSQIQSPVSSHSPQLQNIDYSGGRFPRPAPGCSPLPTRFARPPHHQQGMRVGVPFNARQQPQSPLGSPQPMPSPGNPNSEMNQRGGGGGGGGSAPVSPCVAPGARAHTPAASPGARAHTPAASPLHEHGGGHAAHQPFPPGYLYTKPGLFGGAPIWPERRNNQPPSTSQDDDQHYLLYTGDSLDYNPDDPRLDYNPKDDDDDIEEIMDEHLDDTDIVVVEPAALSPQERIATEEDFEELIDGGKPEDDLEEETTQEKRTETTTKTVAVISLSSANKPPTSLHQYKLVNPSQSTLSRLPMLSATMLSSHTNTKILNEVSQATVASVSIANQTISVPVLKSLTVPMAGVSGHSTVRPQIKKVPLNIGQQINIGPNSQLNKPLTSVISVISSNLQKSSNPIITLATSNVPGASRVPVSLLTQHQVQQKIVKTIEKPLSLSLANTKLSNLSVSHDVHLPAKIFQDDAYSPDSTNLDPPQEKDRPITTQDLQAYKKEIDIESEISQQTELPHTLCLSDRTPMLLGKSDIKSPSPIPEKIPDNIMEGDDDDREDEVQPNILLSYKPSEPPVTSQSLKEDESVVKTIKAIANQTKEMVIGSNMQITSDVAQESVQISIPSPTPSQERYLNDISMHERDEIADPGQKHVESFEDMLCMLENITDDAKPSTAKTQSLPTSQAQAKNESEQVLDIIKSQQDRLNLQTSSVPQLSPLTQPAELTSNMANVSQQLRTIMSSLNTAANKAEASARKPIDVVAPTQVNFENLLPSSKVEVAAPRPSPVPNKPSPTSESIQLSQLVGSRVNTLSSMPQHRKSPSPIHSPVTMHGGLIKSPAQSPLITNQCFISADEINPVSSASQVIQMPMLAKIHPLSTATPTILQQTSTVTTNLSGIQKAQSISTSILGHTLLQPTRQMNPISSAFSSQSISSSQPPALIMSSRPLMGKQEPPPNVTVRHNILSTVMSQVSTAKPTSSLNFITSSKLLHTQLTSPLKRSKSTDEPKTDLVVGHIQPTKRRSVESVIVKSEPMETEESNTSLNTADANKPKQSSPLTQKTDESQNVLLKQLLQTTSSAATVVTQRPLAIQRTAPALGTIPSLEAQLARPPIPPPSLSLPQEVKIPDSNPRQMPPQTTYIQRPIPTSLPITMASLMQTTTQSLMDVRKTTKVIPKEESTPLPENSPTMKAMPIYPMVIDQQQVIKKEVAPPLQSPVQRPFTPMDVKKELLDECSQQSAASGMSTASDQGKLDHPIKDEFPESVTMDTAAEVNPAETPTEAKKRKRREYQQKKRKQMQMNQKAAAENNVNVANAKKRPRKGSKYEEDYDTFIDNLMAQLRLLPPMQIQEPPLTTNFSVCPLFGSGDLTKLKNREYDLLKGDLDGEFGNARIPNVGDYYNTKPFGEEEPLPEKPQASTQRGFYDQEFQPIMFDEDPEEKKLEFVCKERDTDTPDSIVSCSSPECLEIDPPNKFPGLKLIDDEDEEEDSDSTGRISPAIPLIAPVPIRLKPVSVVQLKEEEEKQQIKLELESPAKVNAPDSPGSTDSNENVTVTLTLTSGAAEDILGVLKELAGILHIPPPTAYQIVERTATPPSHKLGLYRSKGKDGKEGAPVDIQSILNGAAKFCRHCDVVILDSVVRAKASEFPLLSANKDGILCDSDSDLYFCSTQCYERFSWRPTNIILDGKSKSIKDDKSDIDANLSKDRDDFDTASTESMETDDLDIKPDIKDEKMDLSFIDSLDNDELMKEVGDDVNLVDEDLKSEDDKSDSDKEKDKYKGVCYKFWSPGCIGPPVKYKRPTDRELTELVFRTGVAMMPVKSEDARKCELCGVQGDGVADGVSRLLNCEVDRWVHLNCALWSEGVYETVSGALMNVETALAAGSNATCSVCKRLGATLKCFKVRCGNVYHLGCAVKDNCVFYKNKTAFCSSHAPKGEKENELTTLSVWRRVFISRDEQRQVASVMLHCDTDHLLRVGGLIFLSPGHLLPHQLSAFHTNQYIYPVGYKIVRFYWSTVRANSRCRYLCWISEVEGRPQFHVRPQDHAGDEVTAPTARAAWDKVLDAVSSLRENRNEEGVLKLWPNYVTGEDLFGLTEPAVVRVLENLPGIETLTDYRFKFGRSALLEGGLALNPSGAARCEGRPRTAPAFRRAIGPAPTPHAEPSSSLQLPHSHHAAQPYTKQFVHTKSSQYKKMKCEWRNNVYLARSKIQGLGLYAARDIEKHTMVIEYIGEIIRSELSEMREKKYEARNRGIYMFRLDERRVVDATLSGGLARYINHSCAPNCVAETVEVDRQVRIIIFAKRRIARGEELAYDYKFDIEDDAHKIQCMCGAPNCRKWMN